MSLVGLVPATPIVWEDVTPVGPQFSFQCQVQRCPLSSHCELWSACELFPSNSSHLVRISLNSSLFARVSCMQTIADVTRILFIGAEPVVFRADSAALLQSSAPHAYINIYSFYTVFLPYIFLWLKNELCIAVTLLLDAL